LQIYFLEHKIQTNKLNMKKIFQFFVFLYSLSHEFGKNVLLGMNDSSIFLKT